MCVLPKNGANGAVPGQSHFLTVQPRCSHGAATVQPRCSHGGSPPVLRRPQAGMSGPTAMTRRVPPPDWAQPGGLGLGAASAPRPRFCAGRRPACPNPTRPFVRNCGNPFGQKPPLTWPFVRNVRKPLQTETASDLGFCAELLNLLIKLYREE